MEQVIIKEYSCYNEQEILALYKSVGWSGCYSHSQVLRLAFENSLCVLGAYVNGALAGLIRAVGDGQTVVLIQDVLVQPMYRRQGIGRALVAKLLARYRHVRQLHLLTDDLPHTVGFYRAVGFTAAEDVHCRAFTRIR